MTKNALNMLWLCCTLLFLGSDSRAQVTFVDVANSLGIQHSYTGVFLEGGVSFCDTDQDGLDDVSLSSGAGEAAYFFRNLGSWVERL